MRKKI
jgi:hypothetical protein